MADPLVDFVRMTRGALTASGLERRSADGMVWFEGGSGAPVVLVHGANDQAGTWAPVAHSLVERFHVIVPDLPGHGESEPREGPIPVSRIVEKLHAVIGYALPSSARGGVTLIGNSLGAWVATLYTLAHPDVVSRLVLESGGGLSFPPGVPLVATNRDDALTILRAVHGPNAVLPDWSIDALIARSSGSPMLRLTEVAENLLDGRLGEVKVPTTIIWGKDDGVVLFDHIEALRNGIAGAKLHVIEGAAHIPHAQQPERFLACLPAIS